VQAKVDAANKLGLVILDSCRNNPFLQRMVRTGGAARAIGRGLAVVEPEGNVLVAYSAKHGTLALDGRGKNSPFTEALLSFIEEPGLEIGLLFRKVRDEVRKKLWVSKNPLCTDRSVANCFISNPPVPNNDGGGSRWWRSSRARKVVASGQPLLEDIGFWFRFRRAIAEICC
jgi:caspase domain-containing protein